MDSTIGDRLREVRKRRGLTQKELAQAAGVSLSLICKLEQGEKNDTRMETAHRLARALRVSTTALLQRDDSSPATVAEPWRPLQLAIEVAAPEYHPSEEPTMKAAQSALREVRAAYFDNRLSDLSTLLVPLLRDADALGDSTDARALRAHLLHIAGSALTQARQFHAADTALRRALDESTDRLRAAAVVTTWTWLLVRQGRLDQAREMAVRWADDTEPRMSRATHEELVA